MAPLPAASLGGCYGPAAGGCEGFASSQGPAPRAATSRLPSVPFSFSLAGCRRRLQCRDASMHRLTRSLTPSSSGGAQPDYSLHHVFRRHYPLSGFWGGERWQAEAREGEGAVAEPHATSPGSALPGSARAGGGTRARGGCGPPPAGAAGRPPRPSLGPGRCPGPQHPSADGDRHLPRDTESSGQGDPGPRQPPAGGLQQGPGQGQRPQDASTGLSPPGPAARAACGDLPHPEQCQRLGARR